MIKTLHKIGPYTSARDTVARDDTASHRFPLARHNLLQLLVDEQLVSGCISADYINWLANELGIEYGDIQTLVEFYHFLEDGDSATPAYRIYLSTNITDLLQGQASYLGTLEAFARENPSKLAVKSTSCTGMCDQGPAALINGFPLTALSETRIQQIIGLISEETALEQWPGELFQVSSHIRKQGPLLQHHFEAGSILKKVMEQPPETFMQSLSHSGLRGRGGAGFPTHAKWQSCIAQQSTQKYIVCNADEGEPGTFKDRVLLTDYLDNLIEGMSIAAWVSGATKGFIYLRMEYLYLAQPIQQALLARRKAGLLGDNIAGTDFCFDIELHLGAGAYVCGEESALIESMEGKRGIPRIRPPFPVQSGYLGKPTIVNNVETFCNVSLIADKGAEYFRQSGTDKSSGSKVHSISGDCPNPGIYEFPFGISIQELLDELGVTDCKLLQISGPAGTLLTEKDFHKNISHEDVSGGGSIMLFNQSRELKDILANFSGFFRHESCGFCTPCRVGCTIIDDACQRAAQGQILYADSQQIKVASKTMQRASHCGLGSSAGRLFGNLPEDRPASEASNNE